MLIFQGPVPPPGSGFAPGTLLDVRATDPVTVIDRGASAVGLLVRGPAGNNPGSRSNGADLIAVAWNGICYDPGGFISLLVSQGLPIQTAVVTLNSLPQIVCSDEQYATGGPTKGLGVIRRIAGTDAFVAQLLTAFGVPTVPFIPLAPTVITVQGRIDYDDPGVGFTFDLALQVNGVALPALFSGITRAMGGPWSALFRVELLVTTVTPGAMTMEVNDGCILFDSSNPAPSLPRLVTPPGALSLPNPPGTLSLDISVTPAGASPVTATLSQLRTSLWRPLS